MMVSCWAETCCNKSTCYTKQLSCDWCLLFSVCVFNTTACFTPVHTAFRCVIQSITENAAGKEPRITPRLLSLSSASFPISAFVASSRKPPIPFTDIHWRITLKSTFTKPQMSCNTHSCSISCSLTVTLTDGSKNHFKVPSNCEQEYA